MTNPDLLSALGPVDHDALQIGGRHRVGHHPDALDLVDEVGRDDVVVEEQSVAESGTPAGLDLETQGRFAGCPRRRQLADLAGGAVVRVKTCSICSLTSSDRRAIDLQPVPIPYFTTGPYFTQNNRLPVGDGRPMRAARGRGGATRRRSRCDRGAFGR